MDNSEFFTQPTHKSGYVNIERLASSGYNTLFSAEREGKRFVLKALLAEHRGDPLYESLLRKEFEIGYSLDHPNICRTYSFESLQREGNVIVMEWLDGRTLDEYIAEKGHRREELERIVSQLCEALTYAHKRQIIHRDLKPQNIIITHNGDNVKLLDFGLSDTDRHTALKEPAGSRKYASPELQRGAQIDSRSDVYSLGIIIDELFEGHKSRRVSRVVTRAAAYYPQARYSDAQGVIAALRRRPVRVVYPILVVILAALGYLFYLTQQPSDFPVEALVPSAQVDGVSAEEFERRQAISSRFYDHINSSYLSLMNDEVYRVNCATPQMPDFEAMSRTQMEYYAHSLDSIMSEITSSSLYETARRNMNSHNNELFTLMRNQFPTMFWLNTEQLFKAAKDPLALELKRLAAPQLDSTYNEMNYEQQQAELARYENAVKEYKRSTVEVWAVAYRKEHNLLELPGYLLMHNA